MSTRENLTGRLPGGRYDEIAGYNFDTGACDTQKVPMCGHYTQVVWSKSTTMGCGSHMCKKPDGSNGLAKASQLAVRSHCGRYVRASGLPNGARRVRSQGAPTILVCTYAPGGNIEGIKPYLVGAQCAACPDS